MSEQPIEPSIAQAVTAPRPHKLSPLGMYVARKAEHLQTTYIEGLSAAKASLARLRRAVLSAPGSDPSVWAEILDGLEDPDFKEQDPTKRERAAHLALTLFAVHQQSQTTEKMHRRGYSLGYAVRQLANDDESEKAVLRRFHALGTASSLDEVAHHARGLIAQLRSERIPLDYGLFADQLLSLQDPRKAELVRLSWGRDYYRTLSTPAFEDATDSPTEGDPS